MSMRIRALALLAVLMAVLSGCSSTPEAPHVPPTAPAPIDPAETPLTTTLPFEAIPAAMLPTELASWQSLTHPPASTLSAHVGEFLFILVAGEATPSLPQAIRAERIDLIEEGQPLITVTATLHPAEAEAEGEPFPRAYLRLPYPVTRPLPRVATHLATTSLPNQPLVATPIPESALPAALASWVSSTVQVPNGVARLDGGQLYLMISGGQRGSGGYAVEIRTVELQEGSLHVTAKLHGPQPGQMVTEVITYPKAYAAIAWQGRTEPPVIVTWQP